MKKKNKLVTPFLKWAGGKRQIIPEIMGLLPKNIGELEYIEPFIGGGAVLFHLQPSRAIINDFNEELINVYQVIKNNLTELIIDLKKHENNMDYFYKIRGLDRTNEFYNLTPIQRASRIIFLNKTCFNGLYRVNNTGQFNVPFGRYKNPNIVNEPILKAVSQYLNANNIILRSEDYTETLEILNKNSFVYLDPPYHSVSKYSNFTGYIQGGWKDSDQIRLREACDQLNQKGIKFLLSNAYTPLIINQYNNYNITIIKANRTINSNGCNRGEVNEVLIRNYE